MPYLLRAGCRMRSFSRLLGAESGGAIFRVVYRRVVCTYQRVVLYNAWSIASSSTVWFPLFLLAFVFKRAARAWRSMFHSSSSYLLLAILQLLQYSCRAGAGIINVPPKNATVPLGGIAEFTCITYGYNTEWSINGRSYKSYSRTEGDFTFARTTISIDGHNVNRSLYLSFPATAERNNTRINCQVYIDSFASSRPAYLTVKGGPAVPEVSLRPVNESYLELSWPVPFTWLDTNITGYEVSSNFSINGQTTWALQTNSLSLTPGPAMPPCTLYQFSVLAQNRFGPSGPGIVVGGFPIVTLSVSQRDISADVKFHRDLSPLITITLTLPTVCSYQDVQYDVTIQNVEMKSISLVENTTVRYHPRPIMIKVVENIERDHTYLITASFALPGLGEGHQPTNITHLASTKLDSQAAPTSFDGPSDDLKLIRPRPSAISTDLVVLICSVGGAFIVSMLIGTVLLLLVWQYRRKSSARSFRTSGSKSPTTPPMVTNPIYEAQPLYEIIDPQFRLPMPRPPGPSLFEASCSSPVENPYKNDIGPYSNCPKMLAFAPPLLEEGYTIMTPARSESKNLESPSTSGSSDQESPDMARYVPDPSLHAASEC